MVGEDAAVETPGLQLLMMKVMRMKNAREMRRCE
jgi:hypothetical protein